MDETLDKLPEEGNVKIVKRTMACRSCDNCRDPAYYKHTFLLPNARNNPASKAYGKDDCSWCSDEEQFACKKIECQNQMRRLEGYSWCATFPAITRFAHMFLYWVEDANPK